MKELIKLLETAEQRQKASQVVRQVRANIRVKNYFGWRTFIDDVSIDLVGYMISTDFKYTVGAYITCGMQSALDHCRYCNALKRRGDYEYVSLDSDECFLQIEDESANFEKKLEREAHCDELYQKIAAQFGEELANQLKPVIDATEDKLDRKVIAQCRTAEFREFLHSI